MKTTMHTTLALWGLMLAVSDGNAAERISYPDLVARLVRMERLAEPVVDGEKTGASTSHDRGSQFDAATGTYRNWSANNDGSGSIRSEGDSQVMVDLAGPGVLWRIWSALPEAGHIQIFLDGQATPVIDKPFRDYFGDAEQEFPGLALTLSRGRNAFIPIPFAKSCKVVMNKGWGAYFHCTHTQFAPGSEVASFPGFTPDVVASLKQASAAWSQWGGSPYGPANMQQKKDTLTIAPGTTREVRVSGAGAVRRLKVKPLKLPTDKIAQEDTLRELTLSVYWDGEDRPSVWAPLGDFFGTSPGLNEFQTRPTGCVAGGFYAHWYMPFSRGMRLVVGNDGPVPREIAIELETVPLEQSTAAKLLRFCAAWHGDDFTGLAAERFVRKRGDRWPDWPLLVVKGRGRFVGMTQHVWKFGGWWGEGDEKFFVDGEAFPSTIGTGSEDYIGYAWAAEAPFVTFDSASAALTRIRPDAEEDTSVCRFHLCDDVPFTTGFQGFMEVMPNGDCRPALYDTCVYWYRERGAENPYPAVPLAARRHQRPTREMKDVLPVTFVRPPGRPGVVEGESLTVKRITSGRHWVQEMSQYPDGTWSNEEQFIWTDATLGGELDVEFKTTTGGQQRLVAVFSKAVDYGVFELSVDGQRIERLFDCYDSKVSNTGELPLGTFDLAPGKHTLRIKVVGQNPKGKSLHTGCHIFGLDYLRTEPAKP
ncbi:MAG: DUF2961 domain-containing protein [Planctomycetes bacterium]|nr:DUF2961 domain-containing protein [Planctomycetota bacterium]